MFGPKEQQKLNEGRLLSLSAPTLLPLLEKRKETATYNLVTDFKRGEKDLLSRVAELSVILELMDEIKRKIKQTHTLEERQHGIK